MTDSETLQSAITLLRKQEAKGRAKYGDDLDSFTGTPSAMADHLAEECADGLHYALTLKRLLALLETENGALKARVAELEAQVSAS